MRVGLVECAGAAGPDGHHHPPNARVIITLDSLTQSFLSCLRALVVSVCSFLSPKGCILTLNFELLYIAAQGAKYICGFSELEHRI